MPRLRGGGARAAVPVPSAMAPSVPPCSTLRREVLEAGRSGPEGRDGGDGRRHGEAPGEGTAALRGRGDGGHTAFTVEGFRRGVPPPASFRRVLAKRAEGAQRCEAVVRLRGDEGPQGAQIVVAASRVTSCSSSCSRIEQVDEDAHQQLGEVLDGQQCPLRRGRLRAARSAPIWFRIRSLLPGDPPREGSRRAGAGDRQWRPAGTTGGSKGRILEHREHHLRVVGLEDGAALVRLDVRDRALHGAARDRRELGGHLVEQGDEHLSCSRSSSRKAPRVKPAAFTRSPTVAPSMPFSTKTFSGGARAWRRLAAAHSGSGSTTGRGPPGCD